MELPTDYTKLKSKERKEVRLQYTKDQDNNCMYCKHSLDASPPKSITGLRINWKLFPPGFLRNPVHLQHCHTTNMTEGVVHAYCNAVMWQYYGK